MRILCLDFDGVCHLHTSPWAGPDVVPDGPVPGLFDFLAKASQAFDVQVFSGRTAQPGGIDAMRSWFEREHAAWVASGGKGYDTLTVSFPTVKPMAFVSLDDRAVQFRGHWPRILDLSSFIPWNKVNRNNLSRNKNYLT